MVILSVSIYVTAAGCGAAETPFFFLLTIELTESWQPSASELTSVKVSWHQQNPTPFYSPLAFFSAGNTIRIGSSLEAHAGPHQLSTKMPHHRAVGGCGAGAGSGSVCRCSFPQLPTV